MAEILLFGATGYTGRLTAAALAERGADFAIAGRDTSKLRELAERTGQPDIHQASVGDTQGLLRALKGARVLVTCVGPFTDLGDTAVEAALRAGVNYVDSTGEGAFVDRLLDNFHERALKVGIAMAPALGFDEVVGDLAVMKAVEGMAGANVCLTYALPTQASTGTFKSAMSILAAKAPWIVEGRKVRVGAGTHRRWAPMPEPLGPRRATAFPLAEASLAPLHRDLRGLQTYVTVGRAQEMALRGLAPVVRPLLSWAAARNTLGRALDGMKVSGPSEAAREEGKWTILAEATGAGNSWRNVVIAGTDVYGLTASLLATGAIEMSRDDYPNTGVLAPIDALGPELAEKELTGFGVTIRVVD
jgi:short subunit dehydrogenase-like uncharacterized protein